MQFLWRDTIDMQGGRILGEGVDGCIFEQPMWPCASNSQHVGAPDPTNTRYVSKLVSVKDEEAGFLKMAERLLGSELSEKYLSKLQAECKPATQLNPPNPKDAHSMFIGERNVKSWPKKGEACGDLRRKLETGKNISSESKLMIISKYPITMSGWAEKLQAKPIPYKIVLNHIEKAIPKFILILQKLFQNQSEQLIHIDLHTGNIFVRFNPLEFGIADFGRCVFRRANEDPSDTLFGEFLITYVSRIPFFCGYSQVPLEARLLSFCYMKKMDDANPSVLVRAWENDSEVRETSSGSTDIIVHERTPILTNLLNRVLFISMVETIQSICRKLRADQNPQSLYASLNSKEKKAVEFILTRYSIISPINTINEELMHVYNEPLMTGGHGSNHLIRFILSSIAAPYLQEGSSLERVLTSIQSADLGILWADIVKGKS